MPPDMMPPTVVREILSTFALKGLLRNPRLLDDPIPILEGDVCIEGQWATLEIALPDHYPLELPLFFLKPWNALGFIPHVLWQSGVICYSESEGLVLDRREPIRILEQALELVVTLLTKGVKGENAADFADEFETYWAQIHGVDKVLQSQVEPAEYVKEITIDCSPDSFVATDSYPHRLHLSPRTPKPPKMTRVNGIYLPIDRGYRLIPPPPQEPLPDTEGVRKWLLAGVSADNRIRLAKLLKKRRRCHEYVLIGAARPSGGYSLFALRFEAIRGIHPLAEGGEARRIIPYCVKRLDRGYLTKRGGAADDLGTKHVLIIGCGAVGGYLATNLAKAGITMLTLVDHDVLKEENIYRHVLGRSWVNLNKADALKIAIEADLPYLQVSTFTEPIENLVDQRCLRWERYDLVIFALGDPTVELHFNDLLHRLPGASPRLFTWVEPLGIGGHALLVGDNQAKGCFECLYTDSDGVNHLRNRAAFAAPNQRFARTLAGCSGFFTPYGSRDAQQTALLASSLALDSLSRREQGNPLLSWKGNAADFIGADYHLSYRYDKSEEELFATRYAYVQECCLVCGTSASGVEDAA